MDNKDSIDLVVAFKKLLAENKSQEERLEEYTNIINRRDREIETLHTMLSESNENRSSVDNQLNELTSLQHYINDLQQQVAGSVNLVTGKKQHLVNTISAEQQLNELKPAYAFLQSQVTDLQAQLLNMNHRNMLLQQQTSRIAELESLLENAGQEIQRMNQKYNPALWK